MWRRSALARIQPMASLIRVTPWERRSLGGRVLFGFVRVAILFALVIVLIKLLAPPITIFLMARWEARKIPAVSVTPHSLADYSVSSSKGTTLFVFRLPVRSSVERWLQAKGIQRRWDRAAPVRFWAECDFHSAYKPGRPPNRARTRSISTV